MYNDDAKYKLLVILDSSDNALDKYCYYISDLIIGIPEYYNTGALLCNEKCNSCIYKKLDKIHILGRMLL